MSSRNNMDSSRVSSFVSFLLVTSLWVMVMECQPRPKYCGCASAFQHHTLAQRRKTPTALITSNGHEKMNRHNDKRLSKPSFLGLKSFSANLYPTTTTATPEDHSYIHDDNDDDEGSVVDNDHEEEQLPMTSSIRYRGRVAYDGNGFAGFQYQSKTKRTVQGELEAVLSRRFNRTIRVLGAGRTDSGVHARGQAFHFDLPLDVASSRGREHHEEESTSSSTSSSSLDVVQLEHSLNRMLRQDVRVWNIGVAPRSFTIYHPANGTFTRHRWSAMLNADSKLYSYRLSLGKYVVMDPIERHTRWHVDYDVDMDQFQRILKEYEGAHDFRAFSGMMEQKEKLVGKTVSTVREVFAVDLVEEHPLGSGRYRVDIRLKGALYKMVRNMIGTAIEVCKTEGKGRIDETKFQQLLHHHDEEEKKESSTNTGGRKEKVKPTNSQNKIQKWRADNPCKPAPPEGLTLERVFFNGDDDDDF